MSDLTDEEKGERIKQWWSDNGSAVIGGVILGIAGLFGWNWWTDRQADRAEAASELYMMVRSHVEAGQFAQASALAPELAENGRGTPYVSMGWALIADAAVRQDDSERAIHALEQARSAAVEAGYRQVMSLRLARHLVAAERVDEAEAVLADVTSDAFSGLRAEVRGDIARARGENEEARRRYEEALAAGHDTEFLRLKLDELAA
ncbi:YfgM family protein [Thioalkalivibrio sp.]|uniref:YfgM family protein n=1 Tax=Thioalkalivibrio sp. TaxID=2093813 RepID=UPI003569093F